MAAANANTRRVAEMIERKEPQRNMLQFLTAHPDIDPNYIYEQGDHNGIKMLHVVIHSYNDLIIAAKLIEMGASFNKDDLKEVNWAIHNVRNIITFIDILLAKNLLSVNELFIDIIGWASSKLIHVLEHLKTKPGFDINFKDEEGNTSLIVLIDTNIGDDEVRGDFIKILRILIQWGADPTIPNSEGETAISLVGDDKKIRDILRAAPAAAAAAAAAALPLNNQAKLFSELNKQNPDLATIRQLVPVIGVNKIINNQTFLSMMIATTKLKVVETLLDLGADPNKIIGKYTIHPSYYSLLFVNHAKKLDMLKLMISKGLDLNAPTEPHSFRQFIFEAISKQMRGTIKGMDDFLSYVIENSKGIINAFSNIDYQMAFSQGNYTPLSYACSVVMYENQVPVIKKLLESGADPNILNTDGLSAFSIAILTSRTLMKIFEHLLGHGMDPNLKDNFKHASDIKIGLRPIELAILYELNKLIDLLIRKGANINAEEVLYNITTICNTRPKLKKIFEDFLNRPGLIIDEKTIKAAESGKFRDEISELILEKANRKGVVWKGWTRSDAEKFDILFTEEGAKNYSCCPVCLKYTIRQDGCLYMHHNCSAFEGFYHKELYRKYKSSMGEIEWCTVCGRICKNHRHYKVDNAQNPVPDFAVPSPRDQTVFFQNDCRGANGGGGLPEKIERIRALRQFARELQDLVDEIPRNQALEQLTETMWNAPAASFFGYRTQKILKTKKWNFETANAFPPNAPPSQVANNNAPNILRPNANKDLLPTFSAKGSNNIAMNDGVPVVHFHHRLPDGTVKNHEEGIGLQTLIDFLKDVNTKFGTEEFGTCPFQCGVRLHPDEVQRAFELFGAAEAQAALVADYRAKYNRKFRPVAGGVLQKTRV